MEFDESLRSKEGWMVLNRSYFTGKLYGELKSKLYTCTRGVDGLVGILLCKLELHRISSFERINKETEREREEESLVN